MSEQVLIERFFETLISGDRAAARRVVDECLAADVPAERAIEKLFYPTLEMVEKLYRNDQLSRMSHHLATRLLRMLTDQMQMRLTPRDSRGKRLLLICGPNEPDELSGQMAADLLEADGYDVCFPGGGVANDEIIQQIGETEPAVLVLFGTTPRDLPFMRQLIDRLHELGVCPTTQIAVGGGVFNRAEGLAEELGADLWARTPTELVSLLDAKPEQRMGPDQRTVGRRRRSTQAA